MQAVVKLGFNGNVLVADNGNIVYQKAFGYSNPDAKKLLDDNTAFNIASVSKQFTAMGIMLLKQQGKLKLSDSLRKYFRNYLISIFPSKTCSTIHRACPSISQ